MKFGFEMELFLVNGAGEPQMVPVNSGLPYDECGWLVEVRSEPHTNIDKAMALFQFEIEKVKQQVRNAGFFVEQVPFKEVPRNLKVQAARNYSKGRIAYQNLYGHETHRNGTKLQTAAVHVSVTNRYEFKHDKGVFTYAGFVDHAKFIVKMDNAFREEIRQTRRNPGFYEVKPDGRIEYRSLPNDIALPKLAATLKEIFGQ